MMYENDTSPPDRAETESSGMFENPETFENELDPSPSIAGRLHRRLPVVLLAIGVVTLALGLHGAGRALVGVAGAHLVLALVVLAVVRIRAWHAR